MPLYGCWEVACVPESKGYWRPVAWGPLELKSQVIVSHSVGTGHWPQVLWRNSKGSYLWAISLTPVLMFWVSSVLLYFQSSCTFIIGLRNASPIFTGQRMTAVFFPMTTSVSSHFFKMTLVLLIFMTLMLDKSWGLPTHVYVWQLILNTPESQPYPLPLRIPRELNYRREGVTHALKKQSKFY